MKMRASTNWLRADLQFLLLDASEKAFLDFLLIHARLRRQHAAKEGFAAHFQAEDGDDGTVAKGGVLARC